MFTHTGIVFRDLKASGNFYRAVLAPIGVRQLEDHTQPRRDRLARVRHSRCKRTFFRGQRGAPVVLGDRERRREKSGSYRLQRAVARSRGSIPHRGSSMRWD